MNIINLYAGPGAGKSTTAAGIFHLMKLGGFKVELITEYAKQLVYSDRKHTFEAQEYIFAKQLSKIRDLQRNNIEWAVTDSPLLLSMVYPKDFMGDFWDQGLIDSFSNFVYLVNNKYNNINYFIERRKLYQKFGRHHTEEESKELDTRVLDMLKENSVDFAARYHGVAPNLNCLNAQSIEQFV